MGERNLTSAIKAELIKDKVQLALFVEILFDSGATRLWSGLGDFTLNGNVFQGVGSLGSIDKIEEAADDIKAAGVAMTLSGIPSNLLALALQEEFQGRAATVWLAFFDESWALINNPIKLNGYRLDYPVINEGSETASITVYTESILADLERARVRRFTNEDQQELYPGDRGLEFLAAIQNVDIVWQSK